MFKRVLIAAAMMIATPGFLFSQDMFWSFDSNAVTTTASANVGTSGIAYLFAAENFLFDGADILFTSSDTNVLSMTGGLGLDGPFALNPSSKRFDFSDVTINTPSDGRFYAMNVINAGLSLSAVLGDPNFVPGVGHRLAELNYTVTGVGDATIESTLGPQGVFDVLRPYNPSFGSATLTGVAVPEPSSAMLLILGSVGLIARRRKA